MGSGIEEGALSIMHCQVRFVLQLQAYTEIVPFNTVDGIAAFFLYKHNICEIFRDSSVSVAVALAVQLVDSHSSSQQILKY